MMRLAEGTQSLVDRPRSGSQEIRHEKSRLRYKALGPSCNATRLGWKHQRSAVRRLLFSYQPRKPKAICAGPKTGLP